MQLEHRRRRGCFAERSNGFEQLGQTFQPFRREHSWHHCDFFIGFRRPQSAQFGFGCKKSRCRASASRFSQAAGRHCSACNPDRWHRRRTTAAGRDKVWRRRSRTRNSHASWEPAREVWSPPTHSVACGRPRACLRQSCWPDAARGRVRPHLHGAAGSLPPRASVGRDRARRCHTVSVPRPSSASSCLLKVLFA